jgi:two-component system sensor histidine kinase AtoS
VTRFNPSAQAILQHLEKDCLGKHYRDIFGREHKLVSLFDDALLKGRVYSRLEFDARKPDGSRLWLGCSSSLINDESGGGMGVVLLLIDLTEIRRLREQTTYSEKMAALGETTAGLAHEVRNSFTAILGFAKLLGKLNRGDERLGRLIDSIKEESSSAESLMSRFLSFARPLDINPERVDIRGIIDSAIAFINSPNEEIEISTQISHDIPHISGDGALLRQAISNLVINACEAVDGGGEVQIRARLEKDERNRPQVVIDVIDNGMGIEPEIESRIFEPFVSGKPHGTGLGLALVKKIIVMHGGRIEVHSKPGKGTRFTIFLPAAPLESHSLGRSAALSDIKL